MWLGARFFNGSRRLSHFFKTICQVSVIRIIYTVSKNNIQEMGKLRVCCICGISSNY
uniref:Uncharacterized protein n=1 Tax=Daphnia galeata TaxID=27404 RepID=A0A8J2RUW4_9CRUS|nr:unnamed protein product [Daphnia galeata]